MSRVRVASAQIQAFDLRDAASSLAAIERVVEVAAGHEAQLLVLPECAYPAYLIGSQTSFRAADIIPPDEYIILLSRLARKKRMHIVSGYVEDQRTCLRNAAVVIDAAGQVLGTYAKSFLWGADIKYFAPGDRVPVFDTELGPLAVVICADTRAPEILAAARLGGARLIAMPTCWVNVAAEPGRYENPQPEFLISGRASEFDLPFVCANKYGMETAAVGYCGRSIITDRMGAILQEAPGDAETVLVDDIELGAEMTYDEPLWGELLSMTAATTREPNTAGRVRVALGADDPGAALAVMPTGEPSAHRVVAANAGTLGRRAIGVVGCLAGADVGRFAPARLQALRGMEILCAFDAPDDLPLLRTRAVENRCFVLACCRGGRVRAIVPDGSVLCDAEGTAEVEIDPADAAQKTVAPGTDIWEQRRVASYRN